MARAMKLGTLIAAALMLVLLFASAAHAPPRLPPTDPVGGRPLTLREAQSVIIGLEHLLETLVLLLSISLVVNLYLAFMIRQHLNTINKLILGMATLQQVPNAMREIAQYWLDRRAERLSDNQKEDLYVPSRFSLTEEDEEGEKGEEAS